jgi:hypothetical protein
LTNVGSGNDAQFARTEDFLEKKGGSFTSLERYLKVNGILGELESPAGTLRI